MREECIISKIKGGTAYISLVTKNKCGGCKACAFGRSNKLSVPAICDVDCKAGDTVAVEMPSSDVPAAALLIFLIPLVALIVGFFVGGLFGDGDMGDVSRLITAFAFCIASFGACVLIEWRYRRRREFMPVIVEVLKPDGNMPKPTSYV
jgi:sigma-E factor negative regulatory protein RseC